VSELPDPNDAARQPYGMEAECTDDQGSPFFLGEF
jgi:hypothetical protein